MILNNQATIVPNYELKDKKHALTMNKNTSSNKKIILDTIDFNS